MKWLRGSESIRDCRRQRPASFRLANLAGVEGFEAEGLSQPVFGPRKRHKGPYRNPVANNMPLATAPNLRMPESESGAVAAGPHPYWVHR